MSRWGTDHDPVGFWTILFAVAGGVLLADLVKVLLAAVLAHAALSAISNSLKSTGTTPGHLPARPNLIISPRQAAPQRDVEELYGPKQAKARAVSRACIAGFAANRDGNGWTQDSPMVPCDALTE